MSNRSLRSTLLATLAALALVAAGATGAEAAAPPLPAKMAALGDSITQAMDSCGYKDCPAYSWATGTQASVASHASRLRAAGDTALVTYNDAVSGSTSAALLGQANSAVAQGANYVTIEISAISACTVHHGRNDTDHHLRGQHEVALTAVFDSSPGADIFVASIPTCRASRRRQEQERRRLILSLAKVLPVDPSPPRASAQGRQCGPKHATMPHSDQLRRRARPVCAATCGCRYDDARRRLGVTAGVDLDARLLHSSFARQTQFATITSAAGPCAA